MTVRSSRLSAIRGVVATLLLTMAFLVGVVALGASCLLVDPPPALPTFPPEAPQIQTESVTPSAIFSTDWPEDGGLNFVVPVAVLDPTTTFFWYVFEDYGTPLSTVTTYDAVQSMANPDGGGVQLINFSLPPPPGAGCHSITFYADGDPTGLRLTTLPGGGVSLVCTLCSFTTWHYDPSGSGECTYDAGSIPEADIILEGSADATDGE
jgi:hypothetical protein